MTHPLWHILYLLDSSHAYVLLCNVVPHKASQILSEDLVMHTLGTAAVIPCVKEPAPQGECSDGAATDFVKVRGTCLEKWGHTVNLCCCGPSIYMSGRHSSLFFMVSVQESESHRTSCAKFCLTIFCLGDKYSLLKVKFILAHDFRRI